MGSIARPRAPAAASATFSHCIQRLYDTTACCVVGERAWNSLRAKPEGASSSHPDVLRLALEHAEKLVPQRVSVGGTERNPLLGPAAILGELLRPGCSDHFRALQGEEKP